MTHAEAADSLSPHSGALPFTGWPLAPQAVEGCTQHSSLTDSEELTVDEEGPQSGRRALSNAALRRIVGERIADARKMCGFDQSVFAVQILGRANSTQVSLWEAGKRLPPLDALIDVARALGVSLEYLTGESSEPERDPRLAARSAVFRRVERLLRFNTEVVTECLLDACSSPAGADELRVNRFASRAQALCESVERFAELNSARFEDARAGATLLRTCREMRDCLKQVNRFLARAEGARVVALQRARSLTQAHREAAVPTV